MAVEISVFSDELDTKGFDCGDRSLNDYLRSYALKGDIGSVCRVFVAHDPAANPGKVLGYYAASFAQIVFEDVETNFEDSVPRSPVPAMRIEKLARSADADGQGIGARLLKDALLRAVGANREMAVECVVVDAPRDETAAFYRRYGFSPFMEEPRSLALAMGTVLQVV